MQGNEEIPKIPQPVYPRQEWQYVRNNCGWGKDATSAIIPLESSRGMAYIGECDPPEGNRDDGVPHLPEDTGPLPI
jgi:hypothetical protein